MTASNLSSSPFESTEMSTLATIIATSLEMTTIFTNDSMEGMNATIDPNAIIDAEIDAQIDELERQSECDGALFKFEVFTNYMLGVASLMILAFCFLKIRRNKQESCLNGRPGLCYPVKLIEEAQDRFVYVAAFAVTGWSIYLIAVNELSYSWSRNSPREAKGIIKLVNCVVVGFLYYPIFAGISSKHWVGYILGWLYTTAMAVGFVLTMLPCDRNDSGLLIVDILRFLPVTIFYAFICIYYLILLVNVLRDRKIDEMQHDFAIDKTTREYKRVKNLLRKSIDDYNPFEAFRNGGEQVTYGKHSRGRSMGPQNSPTKIEQATSKAKELAINKIYAHSDDFKYSTNVLTAVGLSLLVMYIILLTAIQIYVKMEWWLRRWNEISQYGQQLKNSPGPVIALAYFAAESGYMDDNMTEQMFELIFEYADEVTFWQTAVKAIYFFSVLLSFMLCVLLVLDMLRKYKRDLLLMQRGIYEYIPRWSNQSPVSILRNALKFTGYQAGFAASGLILMMSLITLICLGVFAVAALIFRYQHYDLLIRIVQLLWPIVMVIVLIFISQHLLIRFCFLFKNRHGNLILSLDNRHFFFNVQFFMVFINAAMGLLSSLITMVKSAFFGVWTLPRLDMSAFPRSFENFDPGFSSYCSMLKLDHAQRNAVLLVFTSLMLNGVRKRNDRAMERGSGAQKYIDRKLRHERFRNKWALAITLVNNPGLGLYRKLDELPSAGNNHRVKTSSSYHPKMAEKGF